MLNNIHKANGSYKSQKSQKMPQNQKFIIAWVVDADRVRQPELACQPQVWHMEGALKGKHNPWHGTWPGCVVLCSFVLEVLLFVRSLTFFVLIRSNDLLLPENIKGRQKWIKENSDEVNTYENVNKTIKKKWCIYSY